MRDGIAEILASGEFPGVIVRGTRKGNHGNVHVDKKFASANCGWKRRSAKAQEKVDAEYVEKARYRASKARAARRMTKRADDEIQQIGRIPFNLYKAREKERGESYWADEGVRALKADNLYFQN